MEFFRLPVPAEGDPSLTATLECYLLDMSPKIRWKARPAVVICPGGAYYFTNDREAEPVAAAFLSKGFHVFCLRYSVERGCWPAALRQLARAVGLIRARAKDWNVDPERVILAGFSAGGHLAAEFSCKWDRPWLYEAVGAGPEELRPNALLLGYPVITAGAFAHEPSIQNLPALRREVSLENAVTPAVPPTFLWHTRTDEMVPVQNALLFAGALTENSVPYELHIYPFGVHGLGLVNRCTIEADKHVNHYCGGWFEDANAFLDHYLKLE